MDEIQADLQRWWQSGDRRAGLRAVRAITQEWRPRVRRFFPRQGEDAIDEILQDLLVKLVAAKDGARPRALAPPDAGNPRGWRLKVLRHALISHTRERDPRERAEEAAARDLSRAAVRELRERRKLGPVDLPPPEPPADRPDLEAEERDWLASRRRKVVEALPRLPVRRRIAAARRLGVDFTPWLPELARELGEDLADVTARLDGPEHELLYPDGGGAEAYRKVGENAIIALKKLLSGSGEEP